MTTATPTTRTATSSTPATSGPGCPSAKTLTAALKLPIVVTVVRCFHGGEWIIVSGTMGQTGQQADGVTLVHQQQPGSYTDEGGGSDFGTARAGLQSRGVPDDVIDELPGIDSAAPTASGPAHPYSDFVGHWARHEGSLTVNNDHSGQLIVGVGCCDSVSVPLHVEVDASGLVKATAAGKATYTGTAMDSMRFDGGQIIWLHFEQTDIGPMLVTSTSDRSGETYWCSPEQVGQCGA